MNTTTTTFPVRLRAVDSTRETRPGLLLQTTRPLYGEEVNIGLIGFTVDATGLDPKLLEENRKLDAHRVVWIVRSVARNLVWARLVAEYGAVPSYVDDDMLDDTFDDTFDASRDDYLDKARFCPTGGESDIVGCGAAFLEDVDDEGLVDCPACGIWFNPEREATA